MITKKITIIGFVIVFFLVNASLVLSQGTIVKGLNYPAEKGLIWIPPNAKGPLPVFILLHGLLSNSAGDVYIGEGASLRFDDSVSLMIQSGKIQNIILIAPRSTSNAGIFKPSEFTIDGLITEADKLIKTKGVSIDRNKVIVAGHSNAAFYGESPDFSGVHAMVKNSNENGVPLYGAGVLDGGIDEMGAGILKNYEKNIKYLVAIGGKNVHQNGGDVAWRKTLMSTETDFDCPKPRYQECKKDKNVYYFETTQPEHDLTIQYFVEDILPTMLLGTVKKSAVSQSTAEIKSGDTITLKSNQWDKYCSSWNDNVHSMQCNRPVSKGVDAWEKFTIEKVGGSGGLKSGDIISLKSNQWNTYCSSWNDDVHSMRCDASASQTWEKFTIEKVGGSDGLKSGDTISLKSNQWDKYCSSWNDNVHLMRCNATHVLGWENFTIEFAKTSQPEQTTSQPTISPPISAGPQSGAALSQCVDKQVAKTNIPGCQDSQRCKEIDEVWSQKIGLIVSGNNQIWDTQINSLNTFDKVYYTIQQVCGPAQPTTNNQQIIINNQQSTTQKIVTPTTQSTQPTTMASSYSSITIPNVSDDFCSKIKQEPQERFMRKNYLPTGTLQEFINYRTQNYGHFPGFGDKSLNKNPPLFYAEKSTFMGLAVNLNKKIIPALKCVEQELTTKQRCQVCENTQKYPDECGLEWKKYPYQPKGYSTFRGENSYLSGEVSNHVYGIAIDIDPSFNSKVGNGCCGCGDARYKADPLCKNPNLKTYQRMVMPACWIDVFEEYGFYWLGDDPQIQDAMHFEFLGDPTIIERALS